MSTYRVATGHDVALESLSDIDPQPSSPGIEYTGTSEAASGAVSKQGPFVRLKFSVLEDATMYDSILTQFGLDAADYANVTVYVRDERWQWVRKNGRALLPLIGSEATWEQYFPRNITIIVRNLEDPS